MLRSRTLLLFLLKAVLIYGFLSLPISAYDEAYGDFYIKVAGVCFSKFRETGLVQFQKSDDPVQTVVGIGNVALVRADGSITMLKLIFNNRHQGYFPAILLISLVLASPVPWRRKLIALAAGLILVLLLTLFKQWIALLYSCDMNSWLQLTNFTSTTKKLLAFTHEFIVENVNAGLFVVIVIWLLVTFRLDDFKAIPQSAGKNR